MNPDRAIRILKIAAVVTVFLVGYMLCIWLIYPPTIPRQLPPPLTEQEKAQIQERFRYHGIWAAECEGDNCWFIRDGKRCRL